MPLTYLPPVDHICVIPETLSHIRAGALYECDICGREHIKTGLYGEWEPTVKVIKANEVRMS